MAFEQNRKIEIEDVKTELGKKVNTADVRTIEEIQATTDLTGKVASADALKQALIKERLYTNMSADSNGNICFKDIPSADYFILSVVSQQNYTFRLALYSDGSRYYAKVFNADGTLAKGNTIPTVYVHYMRGIGHD